MKFGESFRVAIRSLTVNRLRTALTMLGVIIGVGAVIALVSAGQGTRRTVSEQIGSMGSNLILVTATSSLQPLTVSDVDYLKSKVPLISRAMPVIQVNTEVSWRGNSKTVPVQGVTHEFPEVRSFRPEAGRFLVESDVEYRRKVAVVGQTVVDDIFDGEDPAGQVLTVAGQPFTVVGVMEEKGQSFGMDNDNVVLVPITSLQRLAGVASVSAIHVQVADIADSDRAVSLISAVMDAKFRRSKSVSVSSQKQLLEVVSTVTAAFTVLLASIAGISLLVGGIGIMNIMLVSVTERTREIGLRKAVGAKSSDIMLQFLVESAILSGIGGVAGIMLGSMATRLLARYGGWDPYMSVSSVIMALGFSIAVGVFFGLYPAARAARLDPISSLRYE